MWLLVLAILFPVVINSENYNIHQLILIFYSLFLSQLLTYMNKDSNFSFKWIANYGFFSIYELTIDQVFFNNKIHKWD